MKLTEFLLARIAEDEAQAHETWEDYHPDGPEAGTWYQWVLAECGAKRQIVEWHAETEDCCEERWGPMQWATEGTISAGTDALGNLSIRRDIGGEEWLGCVTLAHLATVYADHPDYREEWKP